jgi:hypothetical protein
MAYLITTRATVTWVTRGIHTALITKLLRGNFLARAAFIAGALLENCGDGTARWT